MESIQFSVRTQRGLRKSTSDTTHFYVDGLTLKTSGLVSLNFVYVVMIKTGKVIKGLGVVRQIESAKTDKHDRPLQSIRIESVSVHFD